MIVFVLFVFSFFVLGIYKWLIYSPLCPLNFALLVWWGLPIVSSGGGASCARAHCASWVTGLWMMSVAERLHTLTQSIAGEQNLDGF